MSVKSPLTNSSRIKLLYKLSSKELVHQYKTSYNIEINRFFLNKPEIDLFECEATGYKFFHPFDTSGDGEFYEQLQKYEWYYMPWKWEHQQTAKVIRSGMKVLEVGCAEGDFIKRISDEYGALCTGLELNEKAASKAQAIGLDVQLQTIQDFSNANEEKFDLVCSFQVLEHISDVHSFIKAMVKCLKKGGTLVIGVPNNDSFLGLTHNALNVPPHHMGLWNERSLNALCNLFPLKMGKCYFEPLQDYHLDYYNKVIQDHRIKILDRNIEKLGFLGRVKNQIVKKTHYLKLKQKFPTLESFTVLAKFSKL
jgi:2-polyprenyl-3-methyl-5-hydroxy-6-metoxy-1,4-benzoquinol methylase